MTTITIDRALLEQALSAHILSLPYIGAGYKTAHTHDTVQASISALRAAIEQDRAQRGEPVAWRAWFDKDSGARWLFSLWPDEENKGLEVDWQPLYTAPQPERKPMSDVEAYALAGAVFPYSQHAKCLELIRDVESHHGIKP